MTFVVQTQINVVFDDRQSEFDGFEPLTVGLTLRINLNFGNQMFHQLFAFKGIHHIVELFKADENFVNVIARDFICFDSLLLCPGIHQVVFGFLDFIVHPVKPLVKVRFADDIVAVIRVKCVDLLRDFGLDGVILSQHFFGGSNFLFDGGGVYFAVDLLLHHGGKLWIADQFDDNLYHSIVQNFLLNLLVEIALLSTLHLAVLATVIRERFIGCAIFLSFGAFVAVHSGTANWAFDKGG